MLESKRKCDKCSHEFDCSLESCEMNRDTGYHLTANPMNGRAGFLALCLPRFTFDLCPGCLAQFRHWLKGSSVGKSTSATISRPVDTAGVVYLHESKSMKAEQVLMGRNV